MLLAAMQAVSSAAPMIVTAYSGQPMITPCNALTAAARMNAVLLASARFARP